MTFRWIRSKQSLACFASVNADSSAVTRGGSLRYVVFTTMYVKRTSVRNNLLTFIDVVRCESLHHCAAN